MCFKTYHKTFFFFLFFNLLKMKLSYYELYKNREQGLVPWPWFADP